MAQSLMAAERRQCVLGHNWLAKVDQMLSQKAHLLPLTICSSLWDHYPSKTNSVSKADPGPETS
jgi:hypothetical protein